MQKYIRQLTADIRSAARSEAYEPTQNSPITSIEDHFAEVEAWLADELPQERIGEILGLEAIQFPPAERLNRNQLRKLCDAFEQTMDTYNVSFDMPNRLPWKTRYQLLVSKLEDSVIICDPCWASPFTSGLTLTSLASQPMRMWTMSHWPPSNIPSENQASSKLVASRNPGQNEWGGW